MSKFILSFSDADIIQNSKIILSKVSIDILPGEFVFLIGRTGTGKSSLIKTIYGDLELKEGLGHVVGFDLTRIKNKDISMLRKSIGVVFQDFKLLPDRNIYKNLQFVLRATGWKNSKEIDSRIEKVIEMVGIKINTNKFPSELSGGEQQRIAIARSILNNPELIIADEPTGNLDPETSLEIIELFQRLNKIGTSMIIATHDYNLILKLKGKVYKCEDGKIFEVKRK